MIRIETVIYLLSVLSSAKSIPAHHPYSLDSIGIGYQPLHELLQGFDPIVCNGMTQLRYGATSPICNLLLSLSYILPLENIYMCLKGECWIKSDQ